MRMSRRAGLMKQGGGITVTLRPSTGGYSGASGYYIGYSLDNGSSYTDLQQTLTTDTIINDVTTIKFRAVTSNFSYDVAVGTTDNGTNIVVATKSTSPQYSSNINITTNTLYYISCSNFA